MVANIFDITFKMTIFRLTFGSLLNMTSAHRIYIKKQSYGRSLKHCLENCNFPCRILHYNLTESPRFGKGRRSRLISLRDHLFFILSLEAISRGTYVGDLFL